MKRRRLTTMLWLILLASFTTAMSSLFFVERVDASPIATVWVTPPTNVWEVGSSFTITLWLNDTEDPDGYVYSVNSWELSLAYDSSILYTDESMIDEGPFLEGSPPSRPTLFEKTIGANDVSLFCMINTHDWADWQGSLATIRFRVDKPGKTSLNLHDVKLVDVDSMEIPSTHENGLFYTTYPRASFSYLPSKNPGATQYPPDSTLQRDSIVGETITFNASAFMSGDFYQGSYDPDGSIESYSWEFGDGDTATETDPVTTHAYSENRTYTVRLTVTDNVGKTDFYVRNDVRVEKRDVAVTNILVSPNIVRAGEEVSINVTVANLGSMLEHFNLTAFVDNTLIWYNQTAGKAAYSSPHEYEIDPITGTLRKVEFPPGRSMIINFTLPTTDLPVGSYSIKANISMVDPSGLNFIRDVYLKELDFNTTNNQRTDSLKVEGDVAVTNIEVSPTRITQGDPVSIKVTVTNLGSASLNFNATAFYDNTLIWYNQAENKPAFSKLNLASGQTITIDYTLTTTGIAPSQYSIWANASLVDSTAKTFLTSLDYNTTNNQLTWSDTLKVNEHELIVTLNTPEAILLNKTATLTTTIFNNGYTDETNVELKLFINGTLVNSQIISELLSQAIYTLNYAWNTKGLLEGTYNITAYATPISGELLTTNNNMTKYVLVAARFILIDPKSGPVGTKMSVIGMGFQPSQSVRISFDDTTVAEVYADQDGNFTATFNIPLSELGQHLIKAWFGKVFVEATFTVVDATPIEINVDAGTIHFSGEIAEFYILISRSGERINPTEITAILYYSNGTQYKDLTNDIRLITTGLYRVPYTLSATAPSGTYTLLVEARYLNFRETAIKSFIVSSTLSGWNAWLKEIKGNITTIVIPDLNRIITVDLKDINATLIEIQEGVGVVNSTLGTIVVPNLKGINAFLLKIEKGVGTVNSTLGTLIISNLKDINATLTEIITDSEGNILAQIDTVIGSVITKLDDINAEVVAIDGNVITIQSDVGTIKTTTGGIQATATTPLYAISIFSAIAAVATIVVLVLVRKKK